MAIGVVVVTFNRIDKLKKALQCYSNQTVKPDYVVVVNNASTDGTFEFLKEWKEINSGFTKYVLNLATNEGGSGGFYNGLKFAQNLKSEWIWVADDDAFPENDAIKEAEKNLDSTYSAICGEVINNGSIDIEHRKKYKLGMFRVISETIPEEEYQRDKFEITSFTYVGTIINKEKLRKVGLPRKEYFIWYDDTEHSLRLHKIGKIMCFPAIKVHHNTGTATNEINWKRYYGIRNQADMIRRHFPKRYYKNFCYVSLIKGMVHNILGQHVKYEMSKKAIQDVENNDFGLDKIYKPGWRVNAKRGE